MRVRVVWDLVTIGEVMVPRGRLDVNRLPVSLDLTPSPDVRPDMEIMELNGGRLFVASSRLQLKLDAR